MAMVWACPLDVESYAAAGNDPTVPRQGCPRCKRPMAFKTGYRRFIRVGGRVFAIWVRRGKCRPCGISHALVPDFCLLGRLDEVAVIGAGVARALDGAGMRKVAGTADVPHTTARDWRRRHRVRAPMLVAGFSALTVALGGNAPVVSGNPERGAIEALGAAWGQARERFGETVVALWRFWSLVSGGTILARARNPPWAGVGGWPLMPPEP